MELELRESGIQDVRAGKGVVIVTPSNVYGASLDDDVFIGPFCEVQRGVRIGPRTRVQSHTFICELVTIGEDCFIGHGVIFVNDRLRSGPARRDRTKWEHTLVGNRVSIGSNATLLPVTICDDVVIGAGSVVTRDIREPGTYAGNPAMRIDVDSLSRLERPHQ